MKKSMLLIALMSAIALSGCAKKEENSNKLEQSVKFDTLETARAQAKENGEFNAKKWRADTKAFADSNMVARGDSTQASDCPQGDGWASIDLIDGNGQKLASLKCSTVSLSVGCLEATDFKTKSFNGEEGVCQSTDKVPFPLPKLAK